MNTEIQPVYFSEEPISSVRDLIHFRDKYHFSLSGLKDLEGEWWDEHKDEVVGHRFVAVSYTDYGGDEYSAMLAKKFREIADNGGPATYEGTIHYGMNAILFGEMADKMCEGKGDTYKEYAPLGDMDDDEEVFKTELINDAVDFIAKDSELSPLSDADRNFLFKWLNDHGNIKATKCDFGWEDMEKALKEFRGEDGEKEDTDAETAEEEVAKEVSEDATAEADKEYADDFEGLTDGESTMVASKKSGKIIAKFHFVEDAEDFVAADPRDRVLI